MARRHLGFTCLVAGRHSQGGLGMHPAKRRAFRNGSRGGNYPNVFSHVPIKEWNPLAIVT
jgi:hypothetical protein